jgi:hypothetical protein
MLRVLLLTALLAVADMAAADPQTDYLLYCRGCHLRNGEAVPKANVPSLHELAPLLATDEGRDYIIRVPGVSQNPMSNQRLAAVLNWVMQEFNAHALPADYRPFTADEVGEARVKVLPDPRAHRAKILGAN